MNELIERLRAWLEANVPEEERPRLRDGREVDDLPEPLRELLAAVDGQEPGEPILDMHELLGIDDMRREKAMMDELAREEEWDEGWWSERWYPFGADGLGQLLVLDAESGAVIEFLHDDDPRPELASSLEEYFRELVDSLESGERIWDSRVGVTTPRDQESLNAAGAKWQAQVEAVGRAQRRGRQIVLGIVVLAVLLGLVYFQLQG